jgi:hypothetical protein
MFYKCRQLTKVVMHDGITSISSEAFRYCAALKTVDIPGSVNGYGVNVFSDCTALEEVRFLNGVTKLPGAGFINCKALRYLEIPDTVESLEHVHFTYLESLETVRIGSGLHKLYEPTFNNCNNLKRFEISPNNATFCSVDGVIYSKDKLELVKLPTGYEGAYEVLPGTLRIGENAANECTKLTALTIPDSVTLIDDCAFRGCKSLETVIFGNGLEELDQGAFYQCASLKNMVLNEGLKTIGGSGFGGCENLESLTIPATVTMIKDYAFSECTGVKHIEFLGDRPTIRLSAFRLVKADAYYPEGNQTWKEEWKDYEGLLSWPQTPGYDKYSGKYEDSDVTWKVDPETGVLTISGQGAMDNSLERWHDMTDLITTLVIDEGITYIPHGTFRGMDHLTDVVIGAGVQKIDGKAFERCTALVQVEILGDGVELGNTVFNECGALETIRFTGDAPRFHYDALCGCKPPKIYYPRNNTTWTEELKEQVLGDYEWEAYGSEPEPDPEPTAKPELEKEPKPTPSTFKQILPWITVGVALLIAGGAAISVVLVKKR